jgi:hypothetical protein
MGVFGVCLGGAIQAFLRQMFALFFTGFAPHRCKPRCAFTPVPQRVPWREFGVLCNIWKIA